MARLPFAIPRKARRLAYLIPILLGVGLLFGGWFLAPDHGRDLLAKAIAAHGGDAGAARARIAQLKGVGTQRGAHGIRFPFTWEETFALPDRHIFALRKDSGSTMAVFTRNGRRWGRIDDQDQPLDNSRTHVAESMFIVLGLLTDLHNDRKVPMKRLEDSTILGRPVLGIEAESKGLGLIRLWFDKNSFLVVKEYKRSVDPDAGESGIELTFSDYRPYEGIAVPRKVTYEDERTDIEYTLREVRFMDAFDDRLFDKR
jgi:hypothetical protein